MSRPSVPNGKAGGALNAEVVNRRAVLFWPVRTGWKCRSVRWRRKPIFAESRLRSDEYSASALPQTATEPKKKP